MRGAYCRSIEFAKELPRHVRLVITLGTPFTGHPKASNAWRLYELVTGDKIGAPEVHAPLRVPPPVPVTSIFSRSDGVVAWQCCVEKEGPLHQNIEVLSGLDPVRRRPGMYTDRNRTRHAQSVFRQEFTFPDS